MRPRHLCVFAIAYVCFLSTALRLDSKELKQTAKNTLTLRQAGPVETLSFQKPFKFLVRDVVDRSGNLPPNLVSRRDGGVFLNPEPREIVRQRVADSLKAAGRLAADAASADYLLTVNLVFFGHDRGIGKEYFFKVDFNVLVENARTKESKTINALGTSVAYGKKNVQVNMENALLKALRSFLRGAPFGQAVQSLEQSARDRQAAAEAAEAARRAAAERAARAEQPSAKEPAEAPPPTVEAGIVLVSSTLEGAEVYVDGGFVGNTPARVKLSPGKYTFRVVMAGEEDWIRELSVMPGSELKVFAPHTPRPAPPPTDPRALSKQDILHLLTNFVPSARIVTLVEQHGIKFKPTTADLSEIAEAGGDYDLLEALRKAAKPGE